MREREMDWPRLLSAIQGDDGRARNVAEWEVCADVVRSIDLYRPPTFIQPGGIDLDHVQSLRRVEDMEELRARAAKDRRSFGLYRNAVLDHEGECAKKLQTLAWVVQRLYRLRELDSANVDIIDRLATLVGDVLVSEWQVKNVPLTGDIRTWSLRSARRYDLCPRLWRYA